MKTKIILFIMAFLSVTINNMNAQSTTGRKIERVGKDVEKTGESVEKGSELFKKIFQRKDKEKTEKQGGNTQDTSEDSTSETNETTKAKKNTETAKSNNKINNPVLVSSNALKPGDIHPDAVVLDVDELFPFYDGAAIVKKGESEALINAKGEFIVPFNTYDFDGPGSKNGFFLVLSKGFVNSKGKFFNVSSYSYIAGEYFMASGPSGGGITYFYNTEGTKFTFTGSLAMIDQRVGDDLIPFQNHDLKMGFKNLQNQEAIPAVYDHVYSFFDGAAIVLKRNEFGELKYGYIDTKGHAITPIQFSTPPLPFSDGFAKVRYTQGAKYSFINKKGEVVFTDNGTHQFGAFTYGYTYKGGKNSMVMDKNMKQYTVPEFLKMFGVLGNIEGGSLYFPGEMVPFDKSYNSPVLPFTFYIKNEGGNYGYIFWDTKTSIYGKFQLDSQWDNEFDTISGLKYAVYKKSLMAEEVIKGYINREGIFMIVKGEASKW